MSAHVATVRGGYCATLDETLQSWPMIRVRICPAARRVFNGGFTTITTRGRNTIPRMQRYTK